MKEKILIVEDDLFISQDLAGCVESLGYILAGIADNAIDALKIIEKEKPDLALLDINIKGGMDGIELGMEIKKRCGTAIIFISALADKKTLERTKLVGPAAYIIKPFDEKDVEFNLELALYKNKSKKVISPAEKAKSLPEEFFVKGKDRLIKISVKDILWLEADDNYCFIQTQNERHIVIYTLKELEEKIAHPDLVRVHRSWLINISKVDAINSISIFINGKEIPVGKTYRDEIFKLFRAI